MKSRNEESNLIQAQTKAEKPRFRIEKLEERIAPKKGGCSYHTNPQGKVVGHYGGRYCGR